MRAPSTCPCGSGANVVECCGPYLAGGAAPTPEALMRSRYTAYALGDTEYVRATWHPGTVPEDLILTAGPRWVGLEIVDAPPVSDGASRGFVEFRAQYRDPTGSGVLHERSRFARQSGRWWYVDGELFER